MIKNYFKLAWRNIRKYGFYSFINITGFLQELFLQCSLACMVAGAAGK